ncbi:hypothetical protein ACWPMX_07935 [Tsuneonella sp. HG094]
MLAAKFTEDTPLPQVGSIGYRRGTGQRVLVLRRNPPAQPGEERTCLVKTYTRISGHWYDDRGSSGNTTVEERDLYPTEDAALHAGRKQRRTRGRR